MNLYLDEDSVNRLLVQLLQSAGHDVAVPSDIGLVSRSDAVSLRYAIGADRSLLTANHDDFRELHDLIQTAGGTHPGILVVRCDNNRRRDMTPRRIVAAIARLFASGVPIKNELIILNQWR
jgi:predicted nuclease of predicted toxin-antitoxin system